ncbi:MAG: chemotaxis protein CheB [Nitrospiraceae bacterium]
MTNPADPTLLPENQFGIAGHSHLLDEQFPPPDLPQSPSAPPPDSQAATRIVAIGASAGGLAALERFFTALPPQPGAAFVVIQHLSPDYPSHMQELLSRHTDMPIRLAQHGELLLADRCYLIPPGKQLTQEANRLVVEARSDVPLHQPIDHFFRSVSSYGHRAAVVVLTGTGSDGSRGVQAVAQAGGAVFVQDPGEAEFPGMPSSTLDAVRADLVGDPGTLALGVYWWARQAVGTRTQGQTEKLSSYQTILEHLNVVSGIDFRLYKQGTILRRLERRMARCSVTDLPDYLTILSSNKEELQTLLDDLLIGVTSFFRDQRVFEHLRAETIPEIVAKRILDPEIRLWVPGCATGEETYSLAMLLHEAATAQRYTGRLRVFATDVHRAALDTAGSGHYSLEEMAAIPQDLFDRYVARTSATSGRMAAELRKIVVFAPHNILADPAFTRVDFVSCRNLLIYFDTRAQEDALGTFLHALNTDGILLLGSSEGLGAYHEEFSVVDARLKLFCKLRSPMKPVKRAQLYVRKDSFPQVPGRRFASRTEAAEPDQRLLSVYDVIATQLGVTGILLDEQSRLVHVFGEASRLLTIRAGRQTEDGIGLLPDAFHAPARTLLRRALLAKQPCHADPIEVGDGATQSRWTLTATPYITKASGTYILLSAQAETERTPQATPLSVLPVDLEECYKTRISELEREVVSIRENLQATVDELQTTNEELQSSNEELQSANEELQSANEELQSVNEELHTVNSEYDQKNRLLADLIRDHDNLLQNTEVGIIFIDNEIRIRRFNSAATRLFRLIPRDVGRSLRDITSEIPDINNFFEAITQVLAGGQQQERTVDLPNGTSHLLRLTPYRMDSRAPEGALITATDITRRRQLEDQVRHGQRLEAIGRLAGGVAHDFNNLLCGIQGYAQLLEERTTNDDQLKPLHAIQEAASQAAALTANLLAFGRKAKVESKPMDVHPLIRSAVNLASTNLHPRICLELALHAQRSVVVGDGAQLQAMVLNLVINAKDSMPNGGTIAVGTSNVTLDERAGGGLRPSVSAGDYLLITVADQGGGIAPEYLDHLFEPFFTTKGEMGHGLGLPAVYGNVSEHGGGIRLTTSDKGTTFSVYLPLANATATTSNIFGRREPSTRGTGTVLVVDDQPAIRELVADFLSGLGYSVTIADNGHRALAEYTKSSRFDLVILDVTMPGMNGAEVFRVIRQMDPDARVLLSSGQTFGQVDEQLFQEGLCAFVQKPFDLTDLSNLVAKHIRRDTPQGLAFERTT